MINRVISAHGRWVGERQREYYQKRFELLPVEVKERYLKKKKEEDEITLKFIEEFKRDQKENPRELISWEEWVIRSKDLPLEEREEFGITDETIEVATSRFLKIRGSQALAELYSTGQR